MERESERRKYPGTAEHGHHQAAEEESRQKGRICPGADGETETAEPGEKTQNRKAGRGRKLKTAHGEESEISPEAVRGCSIIASMGNVYALPQKGESISIPGLLGETPKTPGKTANQTADRHAEN